MYRSLVETEEKRRRREKPAFQAYFSEKEDAS
jgi:hypothetical protein